MTLTYVIYCKCAVGITVLSFSSRKSECITLKQITLDSKLLTCTGHWVKNEWLMIVIMFSQFGVIIRHIIFLFKKFTPCIWDISLGGTNMESVCVCGCVCTRVDIKKKKNRNVVVREPFQKAKGILVHYSLKYTEMLRVR